MGSRPARLNFGLPGALLGVVERHPDLSIAFFAALVTAVALVGGPGLTGLMGLAVIVVLILTYPIIGVAAILISASTYLLLSPYLPKGVPVSFLLLVLTFIGLAIRRVHEPRVAPFRWTAVDVTAAILLLNGLIYIPMAANLKVGIYGYHEVMRLFLIYFVVRLLAPGPATVRALLWSVGIVLFLIVLYGCIQPFWNYTYIMVKYGMVEFLRDYAGSYSGAQMRAYSILGSPLSLGYIGMMGALGAVAILSVPDRNDVAARVAPLFLAASVGAAALSYTRSSWMGLGIALVVAWITLFRGRDRLLLVLLPLVAISIILYFQPDLAMKIGGHALTIGSTDPAKTSLHYVALVAAARFFWDNKLGTGMGSASGAGHQHGGGVEIWSENTYFQMGIQTGFQGMLALILFLVVASVAGYRLSRNPAAGRLARRMGAAAFTGFIGFSMAGVSIPTIMDVSAFGILWVVGALVVNQHDTNPGGAPPVTPTGPAG